jgi:hypothetical protein
VEEEDKNPDIVGILSLKIKAEGRKEMAPKAGF